MSKQQTAVDWLFEQVCNLDWKNLLGEKKLEIFGQSKRMEKERASTFGIRVTSECCIIKNGKMEVDLHKFETLLNEMYGTENSD